MLTDHASFGVALANRGDCVVVLLHEMGVWRPVDRREGAAPWKSTPDRSQPVAGSAASAVNARRSGRGVQGAVRNLRCCHRVLLTAIAVGAAVVIAPQEPARAARPATSSEFRAIKRTLPAVVKKVYPNASNSRRRCFALDPSSARRSTLDARFIAAAADWSEACGQDDSFGFLAIWRFSGKTPRFVWYVNQGVCFRRSPVPVRVQREFLGGCSVAQEPRGRAAMEGFGQIPRVWPWAAGMVHQ
jgi:hypothetical protein